MSSKIKPETYIRKLPFGKFRELAYILDLPNPLNRNWESLAAIIPKSRNSDEPKYSQQQILMFRNEMQRYGGSPTISLLQDWGTQNATARDLVDLLLKIDLVSAAEIILPDYTRLKLQHQQESQIELDAGRECETQHWIPPRSPDTTDSESSMFLKDSAGSSTTQYVRTDSTTSSTDGSTSTTPLKSPSSNPYFDTHSSYISGGVDSPKDLDSTQPDDIQGSDITSSTPTDSSFKNVKSSTQGGTERRCDKEPTEIDSDGDGSPESTMSDAEKKQTAAAVDEARVNLISISEATEFPYSDLCAMTNNFNEKARQHGGNRIGEGAFGAVYIGTHEDSKLVAVKRLKEGQTVLLQKVVEQFRIEVEILSRVKHENIVNLLGYSCDGHHFCLVYDFMPNGSLEDRLRCAGGSPPLQWKLRLNIARDVARGICHLHEQKLIHRDIKSANVLLDEDYVGKVADFGLVRFGPSDPKASSIVTTTVFGTSPYMPKEAFQGLITDKLDTYSYGVVLFELMTGLPVFDQERESRDLPSHVEDCCESSEEFLSMVDTSLNYDQSTMTELYDVAIQCIHSSRKKRPKMNEVLPKIEIIAASE
ncbi:interleukin-1 receptor-associated kinase 4-like [Ptychodera flava]|uniref:interleukin-1 receptor-associated kinase 4-like n=1 Tax=Ptychodera flava TaxID=63121 RepID=UPI003969D9AC